MSQETIAAIAAAEVRPMYPEVSLPPSALYPGLFKDMCRLRPDGIDVGDVEGRFMPDVIMANFRTQRRNPDFSIEVFANQHFKFPDRQLRSFNRRPDMDLPTYSRYTIRNSARLAPADIGSQIGLPNIILSPGGRFDVPEAGRGRSYYWDMWPTSRGLMRMGRWGHQAMRATLNNFTNLIDRFGGNCPNGSATYFQYRSQPPVMGRMVQKLAEAEGPQVLTDFLPALTKHHNFWRHGADWLGDKPHRRIVRMPNGKIMYRFYDDGPDHGLGPRDEMYAADLDTLALYEKHVLGGKPATKAQRKKLFTDIRAGAEHGEDFSGALFKDGKNMYTIHTTDLASVKLNSLQFENANIIAEAYRVLADNAQTSFETEDYLNLARQYEQEAADLAACVEEYCITPDGWLTDYDVVAGKQKPSMSMTGVFALSSGLIRPELADRMLERMEEKFLRTGGFINTLYDTDEQWDGSAWAIMQMEAVDAAVRYGRYDLALKWCDVWLAANDEMYKEWGCLFEKSNPDVPGQPGNGGEYACVRDLLMSHGVDIEFRHIRPWLARMAGQQKAQPYVGRASVTWPL